MADALAGGLLPKDRSSKQRYKATHARTVVREGEEEEGEGDGENCQGRLGEEGTSHPDCQSGAVSVAATAGEGRVERLLQGMSRGRLNSCVLLSCAALWR